MSNLGFLTVYKLLNELPGVACERFFLPENADRDEHARARIPLFTLESQRPVRDFDVVGFSVSYELDYPNLPLMLDLAGVPVRSRERGDLDPVVLAGGPVTVLNPEPLCGFVDAMLVGEAEEALAPIAEALAECRGSRSETLCELAKLPGVYVPEFYDVEYNEDGTVRRHVALQPEVHLPVRRQWVRDLTAYDTTSPVTTPNTEFSNMRLTEVMRGCGRHCRFCAVGYAFLPPRYRSGEAVAQSVCGGERAGLVGASVFDHPDAESITADLVARGIPYSVSSLRADTVTDALAESMAKAGQNTVTIAPEVGSERLRRIINKNLSAEQISTAVDRVTRAGIRRLRLYYMVGLPTEEMDDVEAICREVEAIRHEFGPERLTVSVSCFVPKPGTPFMWARQDPLPLLRRKTRLLRDRLRRLPGVKVGGESPRMAVMEAVLARGDRRVGALVHGGSGLSVRALRAAGVDPAFYAERARGLGETFPWEIVDLGVSKEYLWKEWQRALKGLPDPPCDTAVCTRCGLCPP
jgi:radical SAM superfamily enzyme YgiQ (UPF0313 family)